jgi:hypothetical protein
MVTAVPEMGTYGFEFEIDGNINARR